MGMKEVLARGYARAFARPGTQGVNHALYHLALRGMGYNNGWQLDRSGEKWFVEHVLAPTNPQVCLDIGANVGDYSRLLLNSTNAKVYGFEPLPEAFEFLLELQAEFPSRFFPWGDAVAAKTGTAQLRFGPATALASMAPEANAIPYVREANTKTLIVDTTTLDDWAIYQMSVSPHRAESFNRINFIKIDVEGLELDVLRGAQVTITNFKPKFIQHEWNLHQLMQGVSLRDVAALLPHYKPYQLLPRGMHPVDVNRPEPNTYCYANFVWIRE